MKPHSVVDLQLKHMWLFHSPFLYNPSVPVKPHWIYNLIILISTLAFFLLPMLIISILYLLIGLHLHRERVIATVDTSRTFGPGSISTPNKQKLSKRNLQVTKMLCRCHFGSFFSLVLSVTRRYLE